MGALAAILRPSRSGERAAAFERGFSTPMLIAALLVIPVVVIDQSSVSHNWKTFGGLLNWLVWFAFAAELGAMLTVSPRPREWLRSHPLEAAIVILTPPFLPASLGALRLFRLLRLLRVAIVAKEVRQFFAPGGIKLAAVLAGTAALGGGAIFSEVERGYSMWDGVWWAVTTMATVGYGDLSPQTVLGRLVGVALMFIGVGFFALVTGAIAQRFLATDVREIEAGEKAIAIAGADARDQILRELHELTGRLQRLEDAVREL